MPSGRLGVEPRQDSFRFPGSSSAAERLSWSPFRADGSSFCDADLQLQHLCVSWHGSALLEDGS